MIREIKRAKLSCEDTINEDTRTGESSETTDKI